MPRSTFFSIVVPAHNEERYIEKTLESLTKLNYPKDSYEVIVVENGSSDSTYEKACLFGGNVRVLKMLGRGVSAARNRGIEVISEHADWVLFLDADTYLALDFLKEFEEFVARAAGSRTFVVGTTTITPANARLKARLWFSFYDLGHRLTKSSCSFFIVRASALGPTRFDESMTLMEDLRFITSIRSKGNFFFMSTKSVITSTRRFDADGWLPLFLLYLFVGSLPAKFQRHFMYRAVR